jgi:hypothetical protein
MKVEPPYAALARSTNEIQDVLNEDDILGAQWLEGSPRVEDTLYWFSLLIDTTKPIVGHAAQRRHQTLSCDGGRNILDGVRYLVSRAWAGPGGRDRVGPVLIVDQQVYAARDVVKVAARPGGFGVAGGFGGPVGGVNSANRIDLTYLPARRFTKRSSVRLSRLPSSVGGVVWPDERPRKVRLPVRRNGRLVESTAPNVVIVKAGRYAHGAELDCEPADPGFDACLRHNRAHHPLAGFVVEGIVGNGSADPRTEALLSHAVYSGFPVVRCGKGSPRDVVATGSTPVAAASNLTATKARLLLMAALLRDGAFPPASDPRAPTAEEAAATRHRLDRLQQLFDEH